MKPFIVWVGLEHCWWVIYGRSAMDRNKATFTTWADALSFANDPIIQSLRHGGES